MNDVEGIRIELFKGFELITHFIAGRGNPVYS